MPAPRLLPPTSQLRDIKPPVTIDDGSMYLYWGVIIISVIVGLVALYYLVRSLRSLHRTNMRKHYLNALKQLDWDHPREAAYEATRLGRLIARDDRQKELLAQMIHHLEAHKYKKKVDPISPEARSQVDLFIKACDGSL